MTSDASSSVLAAALHHIDRGRRPIPITFRGKTPLFEDWQNLSVTGEDAPRYFEGDQNIGLVLGARSGGLADIDLDCPEAIALALGFLPPTGAVFGRTSKPRSHYLYQSDLHEIEEAATLPFRDLDGSLLLELRIGGGETAAQTVVPPSMHSSGEQIAWEPGKDGEPALVDSGALKGSFNKLCAAVLLAKHWPAEGARHEAALAIGGMLARMGWEEKEAGDFVVSVAEVAGDPEAKDRARAARDSVRKFAKGKPTTGFNRLRELFGKDAASKLAESLGYGDAPRAQLDRMNAEYSVVQDGGKTRVLRFDNKAQLRDGKVVHRRNEATFLTFQDFRNFHLNEVVMVEDKAVPLGHFWLRHPERRTYIGMTFQPNAGEVVDGRLNLWRGWGVKPVPGDWSLMRSHIEEVVAAGDAQARDYIFHWLAWAVQHPDERAEVALVLRGGRGTGKGTLGNALCRIFGQHATHISSADHLAGRFNAHLRDVSLLFADESYWPGDKGAEGTLKRLITEPTLFIEAKGRDGVTVPNMLHVLMAANDNWVVPAGEHERRFAVFSISEEQRQNQTWFGPLYDQLEDGGLGAMLHDLLNLDLGDWHPRQVPMTDALRHQQLQSLQPLDKWVGGLLEDGVLPGKPGRPGDPDTHPNRATSRSKFRDGLFDLARANVPGLRNVDDQVLAQHLKEEVGCTPWRSSQTRGWEFPPLSECRARWEVKYPAWPWRDREDEDWSTRESDEEEIDGPSY